ncbi:hypothetical protein PHAVU_001G206900 [Phaseolus vulgaris]|uniref:UspA domain-containing protein n=1 Tax=Phaseolus vulgaris TaxID=3885 RepID=V7D1N0_PHAVU|nr:hypothetical protein PHAVU_001G206900g [Phaseolus vulgaris]ESW35101.1 hypothetical protein PHAVU_001G206900g [Phaseolus vulgaris]
MATTGSEKQVIVAGIDDSDFSSYALGWIIDHFLLPSLNLNFKLVLVYARPSAASSVGFVGPGAAEVMPIVEADLKRTAAKVTEYAKDLCQKKSVKDVSVEVVEGDPRNVLCEAVEKHHASMLVVGSHGYGAIKRAVLGSVSDYCAHHAHCTVMIVKKPKNKH